MIIETKYGLISGIDHDNYIEFFSIPYAKPPIGELRWSPPVEPEPWQGIYQADHVRSIAVQEFTDMDIYIREFYSDPAYLFPMNEDCLYLNIWMPKDALGKKLPVAYWIHGGAFQLGYSTEMQFDGEAYCKNGVILVSVEYRCNVWGFLAHPWLSKESKKQTSGNYGLLDQIAGLKWVYENIGAFGGDKDRITIMGQSAGAMSVQALLLSPLTDSMIAGAILQSGGAYGCGLVEKTTMQEAEEGGAFFTSILGVNSLNELRSKSTEEIKAAAVELARQLPIRFRKNLLAPVIDHWVLDGGFDELMDQGVCKNVPCLIGSMKNDLTVTKEMLLRKEHSPLYNGCIDFCLKQEEKGKRPAYVYYFSHNLPGDDSGAFHAFEVWYTFGTMKRCWRPWKEEDYELSRQMITAWTSFVKSGNPDTDGKLQWLPCTAENPAVHIF